MRTVKPEINRLTLSNSRNSDFSANYELKLLYALSSLFDEEF